MSGETLKFACYKILCYYTACTSVNHYNVLHFVTGVKLYSSCMYLTHQSRIGTEKKLLSGLTLSIESAAHLRTTE